MAVVGIDLGTTNTVVASVRGGRVHVLADEQGRRLLPSVVSFHPGGEVLVGHAARERRVVDARNTVASVKRLIGRAWESEEIRRARERFPFELKQGPGHGPLVVVRGQDYTLPEISAFVLRRARQIAERALGEAVDRAVITVPANFNELQRAATKVAGRVAGLEVLRIINEPTAAALAYGLGRSAKERIAIYDFGGGTFDCTLLDLSGNVFEVLATAGDTFLGGDDLDVSIAERMSDAFLRAHRYDPRTDGQAFERLRMAAEALKVELSSKERASARLREIAFGVGGAHLDLDFGMAREELDALAAPLVERTFAVCQEALSVARLPVSAFDKVILVGGSTRIPLVRRRVEQFFGAAPLDRVNPDEVVGIGAAIQAAALTEVARRRSIPPPPSSRASAPSYPPRPSQPSPAAAPPPTPEREEDSVVTVAVKIPSLIAEQERARAPAPASRPPPPASRPPAPASRPPSPPAMSPDPAATLPTPLLFEDVVRAEREAGATWASDTARTESPMHPGLPIIPVPGRPAVPPAGPLSPSTPSAFRLPVGTGAPAVAPAPPGAPALPQRASPLATTQVIPRTPPPPPPAIAGLASPVLVDVTPLALVVETAGGWCDVVVQRNAKIPCERTRAFTTSSDGQTAVHIRVGQGEDAVFGRNTLLGEVELSSIQPAPRGQVTIQVRFELDESGTLQVSATDVASGRQARATLQLVGIADAGSIAQMRARQVAARVQ